MNEEERTWQCEEIRKKSQRAIDTLRANFRAHYDFDEETRAMVREYLNALEDIAWCITLKGVEQ